MKRFLVFCLFLLSYISAASAKPAAQGVYFGVGAGGLSAKVSGNNYLGTGMGWPDDYYGTQSISNEPYFYIAGGYTWARASNWLPYYSLGLRYLYVSGFTVKGYIDQYSLPGFKNYTYSYDVELMNVLATFKVDIYRWHGLMPYIIVGAGAANYGTSDYTENALVNVTPRVSPGFASNSATNFMYSAGLGLEYLLEKNLTLNLEYSYNNFGTVRTGKGADTVSLTNTNYSNESLKNKITANALLFGVTYYIS